MLAVEQQVPALVGGQTSLSESAWAKPGKQGAYAEPFAGGGGRTEVQSGMQFLEGKKLNIYIIRFVSKGGGW